MSLAFVGCNCVLLMKALFPVVKESSSHATRQLCFRDAPCLCISPRGQRDHENLAKRAFFDYPVGMDAVEQSAVKLEMPAKLALAQGALS
jgi:hypothetical protein